MLPLPQPLVNFRLFKSLEKHKKISLNSWVITIVRSLSYKYTLTCYGQKSINDTSNSDQNLSVFVIKEENF